MKNVFLNALAILLLASCAPLKLHYKEGQPVSRMNTDLAMCRSQALEQVPKDIRTRYIPPVYPAYGYYWYYGGHYYPYYPIYYGHFEKFDANQAERDKLINQCMADQGYTLVKIPVCNADIAQSASAQPTEVMPPLTEKSCVIRLKSGSWQIVNPG